jgi:hypothetical protein
MIRAAFGWLSQSCKKKNDQIDIVFRFLVSELSTSSKTQRPLMGWKTYLVTALLAPLVVGSIYGGVTGIAPVTAICRAEALIVVPLATTGVLALIGGCYTSRNCHNGCHAYEEASLGLLLGGFAGLVVGSVIDGVLMYKWLAH